MSLHKCHIVLPLVHDCRDPKLYKHVLTFYHSSSVGGRSQWHKLAKFVYC